MTWRKYARRSSGRSRLNEPGVIGIPNYPRLHGRQLPAGASIAIRVPPLECGTILPSVFVLRSVAPVVVMIGRTITPRASWIVLFTIARIVSSDLDAVAVADLCGRRSVDRRIDGNWNRDDDGRIGPVPR